MKKTNENRTFRVTKKYPGNPMSDHTYYLSYEEMMTHYPDVVRLIDQCDYLNIQMRQDLQMTYIDEMGID